MCKLQPNKTKTCDHMWINWVRCEDARQTLQHHLALCRNPEPELLSEIHIIDPATDSKAYCPCCLIEKFIRDFPDVLGWQCSVCISQTSSLACWPEVEEYVDSDEEAEPDHNLPEEQAEEEQEEETSERNGGRAQDKRKSLL
ncbi:hypothetical protein B0T19DRAFT_401626 [Cercophora scortea]|uniref:Uncharacterized protein n=1 Tax=Cercophora scortea TaxID=314031 RepID=A0AAE0IDT9_9PEZI|nr:hypothetical protein B0T19DRAFT_401626 [Cercophora scortea]